jgi:hypothetical protein
MVKVHLVYFGDLNCLIADLFLETRFNFSTRRREKRSLDCVGYIGTNCVEGFWGKSRDEEQQSNACITAMTLCIANSFLVDASGYFGTMMNASTLIHN